MKNCTIVAEFKQECTQRGFYKNRNVFSRCVGDGIYQNISLAEKSNVSSAVSTQKNGKMSPYIKLGFWSMYSNLPAIYFTEREHIGKYMPENIIGQRFCSKTFRGIDVECQIMLEKGFDYLDSMKTQRTLLDASNSLNKAQYGIPVLHEVELVAPHLICSERAEALNHLYGHYAQYWLSFHANHDHLRSAGDYQQYIDSEIQHEDSNRYNTEFLKLVLGGNQIQIRQYLSACFEKNVKLAKMQGIPFLEDFFSSLQLEDW